MMRAGALVMVLALVACSRGEEYGAAQPSDAAKAGDRIRCATGAAAEVKADCTREIARGPDGEVWVIRHRDGSFRRFVLIDKGTRIATADGAEEVRAERVGADLDVRVAGERYLFPAAADAPR